MFERFRKKDALMSPEAAAAMWDTYARSGLPMELVPDLDPKYRSPISLLFYFTKAAIVIQWLRILEQDTKNSLRVRAALEEFERLTFSGLKQDQMASVIEGVGQLIKLTSELREFVENTSSPKEERTRHTLQWLGNWFKLCSDDPDFKYHVGPEAILLYFGVHHEIGVIGTSLGQALIGKDSVFVGQTAISSERGGNI